MHYILAGAIILLMLSLGYAKVLSMQLEASKGQYRAFVAETQAAGIQSEANERAKELELSQAAVNIQEKLNETQNSLNKSYAANDRLRRNKSSGSGQTSSLSEAAKRFNCTNGQTDFAARLEQFETRTIEILKRGDVAINRTIGAKEFLESQERVLRVK